MFTYKRDEKFLENRRDYRQKQKQHGISKRSLNKVSDKGLLWIIGISVLSCVISDYFDRKNRCPECNGTGQK